MMDTQLPPRGESGSNTGRFVGATSNMAILGTQQELRHNLVHRHDTNPATKYMTHDAYLIIVQMIGSSKNKKRHAVGCEYIHIVANSGQLTI
jgi:hypothetical protein